MGRGVRGRRFRVGPDAQGRRRVGVMFIIIIITVGRKRRARVDVLDLALDPVRARRNVLLPVRGVRVIVVVLPRNAGGERGVGRFRLPPGVLPRIGASP